MCTYRQVCPVHQGRFGGIRRPGSGRESRRTGAAGEVRTIRADRAIHLTGGVLVGSPWPVRWRALQTGRFPAAARRRWWRLAGLLVDDQISVPDRAVIDRELEDPVEDHASAARSAAVEPEHELVHVRR